MTCTNQQIMRLKQMSYKYNKGVAAAKSCLAPTMQRRL